MTEIRRILIASDPLMTKEKEQFSNRRWMKDLLTRPIERATGLVPESLASSLSDPALMDRRRFFGLSDIDLDIEATQFWYDCGAISTASMDYLSEFVSPGDLVIGYELSAQTRNLLGQLGVPYIDIWLHPVRFMDDVLFGFNASDPSVRDRLFSYDVPRERMFLYADRLRVQTYKGWHRAEARIAPGSALFVGQMLNDKSVCSDGRMLSVLDFQERFREIASAHPRLYYARHPYLKSGDEDILRWLRSLPNVEIAREPGYRMLASQRLDLVFGISSSLIDEASYFGKRTEYLFRPVLAYGNPGAVESYATILQDFVSPHFWADILSPVMETKECPEVRFLDPKDKIRDMLGFYWSYGEIDKAENMRRRLLSIPTPKTSARPPAAKPAPRAKKPPAGFIQTAEQMRDIEARIAAHEVISFDIFDTLIERIVDRPEDIFGIMSGRAREITGGRIDDFPAARRAARDMALDRANGEEVLLADRYAALAVSLGLAAEVGTRLLDLELEIEEKVCRPRYAGRAAFDAARKTGKRIVLVSDIYHDRTFVERLLLGCGYRGWDRLYLSSDEGVLKHTGRLFDRVIACEARPAASLLHMGDNLRSDIEMARSRGIAAIHLPDKADISTRLNATLRCMDGQPDPSTRSLLKGLVARHETNGIRQGAPGFTGGEASRLGYSLAGPAFAGFAAWVAERSRQDGVTDIYFLARDGDIVKRCYGVLAAADPSLPRPHYLLASRRALSVALLDDGAAIQRLLERNFTPCPLDTLIENRFGLDPGALPRHVYARHGFASGTGRADWRTGEQRLRAFFLDPDVTAAILENAARERRLLVEAYREAGLGAPGVLPAFVDIGHSGTLQAAIAQLLALERSQGYYFATKSDVDRVLPTGHEARGYAVDRLRTDDTGNPYQRHILMFELLFQNDQGSFVRYETTGGATVPRHLDLEGEEPRIALIRQVHAGAVAFAKDLFEASRALGVTVRVDGPQAIKPYLEMLREPWPEDAALFVGVGFENRFSARDIRWILPPPGAASGSAIWSEGKAVLPVPRSKTAPGLGPLPSVIQWTARQFVGDSRKRAKLERDPAAFFADSRFRPIRGAARFF